MKPPDLISSNEMKKPGRKTGLFVWMKVYFTARHDLERFISVRKQEWQHSGGVACAARSRSKSRDHSINS
jgi:hypothetical protein